MAQPTSSWISSLNALYSLPNRAYTTYENFFSPRTRSVIETVASVAAGYYLDWTGVGVLTGGARLAYGNRSNIYTFLRGNQQEEIAPLAEEINQVIERVCPEEIQNLAEGGQRVEQTLNVIADSANPNFCSELTQRFHDELATHLRRPFGTERDVGLFRNQVATFDFFHTILTNAVESSTARLRESNQTAVNQYQEHFSQENGLRSRLETLFGNVPEGPIDRERREVALVNFQRFLTQMLQDLDQFSASDPYRRQLAAFLRRELAYNSANGQEIARRLQSDDRETFLSAQNYFLEQLPILLNQMQTAMQVSHEILLRSYLLDIGRQCAMQTGDYANLQLEWREEEPNQGGLRAIEKNILAPNALLARAQSEFLQRIPQAHRFIEDLLETIRHRASFQNQQNRMGIPNLVREVADRHACDPGAPIPTILQNGYDLLNRHLLTQTIQRVEPITRTLTSATEAVQSVTGLIAPSNSTPSSAASPPLNRITSPIQNVIQVIQPVLDTVNGVVGVAAPLVNLIVPTNGQQSNNTPVDPQLLTAPRNGQQSNNTPANPQPLPINNPPMQEEGANAPQGIDAILAQGGQTLTRLIGLGANMATNFAASSLASLFHLVLFHGRQFIPEGPNSHQIHGSINQLIPRLQTAAQNAPWADRIAVLQETIAFLRAQQIYFQGFRIPLNPARSRFSAIPNLLDNINRHQNALQSQEARQPQVVTKEMIKKQTNLLKARMPAYTAISLLAKKMVNLDDSPVFYAEILAIPADAAPDALPALFRDRFFDKIEQSQANFFVKWFTKRAYSAIHLLTGFYATKMIDNVVETSLNLFKNDPNAPNQKQEYLVKTIRNWLAVTSGAYHQVATLPPSRSKDFNLMIEEMLKIPERNGGLTQKQLYAAAAKAALDAFGPKITWDQMIENHFSWEIPTTSPFHVLNWAVKGFNLVARGTLKLFTFIPQWLGNKVLQIGAKLAVSNSNFLQQTAESKIESLKHNTASAFAMQGLMYRQLQKVLLKFQEQLGNNGNPNVTPALRNTHKRDLEVKNLLEYIFQMLNNSQYRTHERLQSYVQGRAPLSDRITHELEETFLPEVMGPAIETITSALQTLTEESELNQLLHDSLLLANSTFDVQQPVSNEAFAAAERANLELIDQIIEAATFHAIEESFDFGNEKQQRDLDAFIVRFRDQTTQYSQTLNESIAQIENPLAQSGEQLHAQITLLIQSSTQFNTNRLDALSQADGNRNFHTSTKNALNALSGQLLELHCTPLSNHLNNLKNRVDEIRQGDKWLRSILSMDAASRDLTQMIANPRIASENLSLCHARVREMRECIQALKEQHFSVNAVEEQERELMQMANDLQQIEIQQQLESALPPLVPLFEQLHQEKLKCLDESPSIELNNLELKLLNAFYALPLDEQHRDIQLHLDRFMKTKTAAEARRAAEEWRENLNRYSQQNLTALNLNSTQLRTNNSSVHRFCNHHICDLVTAEAQKRTEIQETLATARNATAAMGEWAAQQTGTPIWNIHPFGMEWVTETIKNLASNRAQAKMRLFFDALYQRPHFIGMLNQSMVAFISAFGKQYLKSPLN